MARSHRSFKKTSSKASRASSRRAGAQVSARVGQTVELHIERFSHDGRGIGKLDGKTCFVEGALPHEQVQARIRHEQSKYIDAQIIDQPLQASEQRIEPGCVHYGRCGGCNLQHLAGEQQLPMKDQQLHQQFYRQAKIKPETELAGLASQPWGYRRAARLSVKLNKDGSWQLGYRRRADSSVIAIKQCPILVPELEALLPNLQALLSQDNLYKSVSHIELGQDDSGAFAVLRIPKSLTETQHSALVDYQMSQGLKLWLQVGQDRSYQTPDGQSCEPELAFELKPWQLNLSYKPSDFVQVNSELNEKMIAQALMLLNLQGDERVLDLFCGIGNFTLPLARFSAEVVGVEAIEAMVARGRVNAEQNGLTNVEFISADLETDVSRASWARKHFDVLVLDPPRAGARGAMNWLAQLQVNKILYVSCNPATFARDAQLIQALGYRLKSLGAMDMFPQTAHVEAMGLFEKI